MYGHSFGFAGGARAVVGVAAGGGSEPTEIDLSADLPATFSVGTVF